MTSNNHDHDPEKLGLVTNEKETANGVVPVEDDEEIELIEIDEKPLKELLPEKEDKDKKHISKPVDEKQVAKAIQKSFLYIISELLAVISLASFGAFFRTALTEKTENKRLIINSFWTNIVGCFILGFYKNLNIKNDHLKFAIGTGLCGSITTFSSFNYEVNVFIIRDNPKFGNFFGAIFSTVLLSIVSFSMGLKIGELVGYTKEKVFKPINDKILVLQWLIITTIVFGISVGLSFTIDHKLWLACLIAPFGALLRYYLGVIFNKTQHWIKLGTLLANLTGSFILSLTLALSNESEDTKNETLLIKATTTGFCGCLSTVSTFVSEMYSLYFDDKVNNPNISEKTSILVKFRSPLCYFLATMILGQLVSSVVLAIDEWTSV